MTVTQIRPYDKKRSEVLTDEELRFVLYRMEIERYGLAPGVEIPDGVREEILTKLLPKRAKLRAMNLLKSRDYTEERLREKLSDGGYPAAVVEEAVAYVKSYGYVDDVRYARDFIRGRMNRESRRKIEIGLAQRGVAETVIRKAMEELYADDLLAGEDPEIELIRAQIRKKGFDPAGAAFEERQKFLASMARRGFSIDKVRHVLEEKAEELF